MKFDDTMAFLELQLKFRWLFTFNEFMISDEANQQWIWIFKNADDDSENEMRMEQGDKIRWWSSFQLFFFKRLRAVLYKCEYIVILYCSLL